MTLLTASVFAVLLAVASAQAPSPAQDLPQGFGQTQAQLRRESNSSFQTSFDSPGQVANTGNSQYGNVSFLLQQNSPALSTLPAGGLGQGIIQLQGCAIWTPHSHPRANEILYVAEGSVQIAFHEENAFNVSGVTYGGRTYTYNVSSRSSVVIPQGLLHYAINSYCEPAFLVTSFDNKDPGTVTVAQQLFSFPDNVLMGTTDLPVASIGLVRNALSQTTIIATDEACASRCRTAPSPNGSPSTGR